jgi:hypothetical protein
VNPGATTAAILTVPAAASNFWDGSFNSGPENWGVCREPNQQYQLNGASPGVVIIQHKTAAAGSLGPHMSVSSSVPTGNRACRLFGGAPTNGSTLQTFTAWVKSADGSDIPLSSLQLTGLIHQFSWYDPSDFYGSSRSPFTAANYFTATSVWQKITVPWTPPTGADGRQTVRDSFFAAVIPGITNKAILVDEVEESGSFDPNPCNGGFWSRVACSGQGTGGGTPPKDNPLLPSERSPRFAASGSSVTGLEFSWSPPALGTPTAYRVRVYDADTASYLYQADLGTATLAVNLPGGVFGHSLLYEVGAVYPDGVQWAQGVFDAVDGVAVLDPPYIATCPSGWNCVSEQ